MIGPGWEIGAREVCVGGKVYKAYKIITVSSTDWWLRNEKYWLTKVNNELNNLHNSDVLLPPNAHATGALEVVPVHDNMDHQVEGDWNP
jgi:hypothetical protein